MLKAIVLGSLIGCLASDLYVVEAAKSSKLNKKAPRPKPKSVKLVAGNKTKAKANSSATRRPKSSNQSAVRSSVGGVSPKLSKQEFRNKVGYLVQQILEKADSSLQLQTLFNQMPDAYRLGVARELMEKKAFPLAYGVLISHKIKPEENDRATYLEVEGLAGFISLSCLNTPSMALSHFQRCVNLAQFPVSRARAFFWLGLTYRQLNDSVSSLAALNMAAVYATTFYGQLAQVFLQRIAQRQPQIVVHAPTFRCTSFGLSAFQEQVLANEVARLFLIPRGSNGEAFPIEDLRQSLLNYYEQLPDFGMRGALLASLRTALPFLRVRLYKRFFQDFHMSLALGYPLLSEMFSIGALETFYALINPSPWLYDWTVTLAHAIILHESEFNPGAVSVVGAQGMMQLMPQTASREQQRLASGGVIVGGAQVSPLLSFGNLMLGSSHLRTLEELFGPNIFLVAAAYNAGADNVKKWLRIYGDPRCSEISMLEWLEMIPFRETRNYVQRVAEAFVVYSHLLGTEYLQELVWGLF